MELVGTRPRAVTSPFNSAKSETATSAATDHFGLRAIFPPIAVNFTQIVPMMTFLVIATIVMLVFMLRDLELTIRESHVMMLLYLGFGLWMTLEAFGVTSVLGVRGGP